MFDTGKTLDAKDHYGVGDTLGNGATCKVKLGQSASRGGKMSALKLMKDKMADGQDTWPLCEAEV